MKQCTCYALRAVDCTCKPAKYGELYTSPTAKQEQGEPHSWYSAQEDEWMTEKTRKDHERLNSYTHKVGGFDLPLYTTLQQRTWVGLTDEEIDQGLLRSNHALQTAGAWRDGVEWATKQLREKNNE
jgi:hypothetical protein